jgi:DNA (cytosine-5)-methyltransferase 1
VAQQKTKVETKNDWLAYRRVSIASSGGRNEIRRFEMTKISCVDLFCGAGGLTHGFVLEGVPVVAGIDMDPACRFPYEANNRPSL